MKNRSIGASTNGTGTGTGTGMGGVMAIIAITGTTAIPRATASVTAGMALMVNDAAGGIVCSTTANSVSCFSR
ncbi:hypothetical protein ASG39_13515 [Rhizobium sp. Leaf371]|uniref:hypothetical protein n=1 Tax=Rhizobium sp. Leaf371 TaxID=1736355 RepID=UPI0007133AF2|nr:hypothetical protein [Rhizobium sp. Leaf371]KQS64178.1 hypothetical protein ASG39_13515 [Rhizobium sp. Leaf371]